MNPFLAKPLLLIFASLFVSACDKDDNPAPMSVSTPEPAETHPVEAALDGTYWRQDKVCFVYTKKWAQGELEFSDDIINESVQWSGGKFYYPRLEIFSVESDTRKVREYDSGTYVGSYYYHNRYIMEYPDGNHVLIRALDELTGYVGAAFNVPLEVVSCTDEEIILDGPIKPYIWQEWKLDEISEYQNIIYLGIRVYWTKIENGAELLEPSNPLD